MWLLQEDSISIWRTVCENPLLAGATLILFFNKVREIAVVVIVARVLC